MLFQFIRLTTFLKGLTSDEHLYESERVPFERQAALDPLLNMRSLERKPDGRYADLRIQKAWLEHVENEARADRHV